MSDDTMLFPADVSVRIEGDLQDAQGLMGLARQVLFKAQRMHTLGKRPVTRLFARADDGSFVQAFLAGPVKQLYISPAPRPVAAPAEREEVTVKPTFKEYINDMWSGLARAVAPLDFPSVVAVPNPDGIDPLTVPALNVFHPDRVTSAAYGEDFAWIQPPRLGVAADGSNATAAVAAANFPKPSMFSGAMRRVVSAVLGLGHTVTETPGYINGELPVPIDPVSGHPIYNAWNQYDYRWVRSHGIYFSEDNRVWLVEISKERGVLAMPLPIFDGTDDPEYRDFLRTDTDTLRIVDEFGGLPTGEPFPTGVELDDAIASGLVLELATDVDIVDFYTDLGTAIDKGPFYGACGWAFSPSGSVAHNITTWYSNPTISGASPDDYISDGHDLAPANQRFMRVEHKRIRIEIVPDPTGDTLGVGTAVLEDVEDGLIVSFPNFLTKAAPELQDHYNRAMWRVPGGDVEGLDHTDVWGRTSVANHAGDVTLALTPVVVHVLFAGDVLHRVYYRGNIQSTYGQAWFYSDTINVGGDEDPPAFVAGTYHSQHVGFVIPAFEREGYLIVRYSYFFVYDGVNPAVIAGLPALEQFGYFADLTPARIDFTTRSLTKTNVPWVIDWFAFWTNYQFSQAISCAASVNTGPLHAYVMSDGIYSLTMGYAFQHYVNAAELLEFELPDETPALGVTFVGSVDALA